MVSSSYPLSVTTVVDAGVRPSSAPLRSAVFLSTFLSIVVLGATLAPGGFAQSAAAGQASPDAAIDGLWSGVIFLKRGSVEAEIFVELARDSEGVLGGNVSLPAYGLKYVPIDDLAIDGSRVSFTFSRYSPRAKVDVISPIRGTLSSDGERIEGEYVEGGQNSYPIELVRIGPPGTEPPVRQPGELIALADDSRELVRVFNADRGKVRALLLVSPTCPLCLGKARMLQRYLLDRNGDQNLALYLVWGPMQGNEKEEDARKATAALADPRAAHFWTPVHDLAEAYREPLGLADDVEPAWDTYMVFAPDAVWGEEVPAPSFFMWEEKPLAKEGEFNAEIFAAEIEKRLSEG